MQKLLVIGDAGAHTGFARVVKGVCDYLAGTGTVDVRVRAINLTKNHNIDYTYEVLPVTTKRGPDPLGFGDFRQHIKDVQPDVLLVVQDMWNITNYMARKPPELPTVAYFPVDTPNIKWGYALGLGAVSEAVTYTQFGAREAAAGMRDAVDVLTAHGAKDGGMERSASWMSLAKDGTELHTRMDRLARYQNPRGVNVVPHGLEHERFQRRDKAACRRQFGLPDGAFVIGSVQTNQFRKRHDILIRAFAAVKDRIPNGLLILHCAHGDMQGWDLAQLVRYYGVQDRVILSHLAYPVLSDDDLVSFYNTFDVHVNVSGGEGWGLTSFESAACGVPQLVPDWSATRELWTGYGRLLTVADYRAEPRAINTMHAIVSVADVAEELVLCATLPDELARYGALAQANAARQLSWGEVGQHFATILEQAVNEPAPTPHSYQQLREAREGEVESELSRAPLWSASGYPLP